MKDNQIMQNTITANSDGTLGGGVALWCNGILVSNQISYNSVFQNATNMQAISGGIDCEGLNIIMESKKNNA